MGGFIKWNHGPATDELLRHPVEFWLLAQIAYRARRTDGCALIGDLPKGISKRQYRTAKKRLTEWNFATFKATSRGTIARIIDTRAYDINILSDDKQNDKQVEKKRQLTRSIEEKRIKEKRYIAVSDETLSEPDEIFAHWNAQKIIIHRKFDDKTRRQVKARLRERTKGEITASISNYACVLNSDRHFWSHRWTLCEFLQRGLEKFLDEADPMNNYLSRNEVKNGDQTRNNFGDGNSYPVDIE